MNWQKLVFALLLGLFAGILLSVASRPARIVHLDPPVAGVRAVIINGSDMRPLVCAHYKATSGRLAPLECREI